MGGDGVTMLDINRREIIELGAGERGSWFWSHLEKGVAGSGMGVILCSGKMYGLTINRLGSNFRGCFRCVRIN